MSLIVVIGISFIVTSAIYKGAHSGVGSIILDKGINIEISDADIDNLSRNMSIPVQYYTDKSATIEANRKDFSVEPTSSTEYYIANPTIAAEEGTEPFYLRVKLNALYYVDGSATPTAFSMSTTEKQILYGLFSTDSNYSPIKFNDYFAADANGEYYYYVSGGYGVATRNNLQFVKAGDEIKLFQGFLANDVTPVSSVYFKYFESIPNNVTKISFTLDIELATAQIWDMPDVKLLTEDEITLSEDKTEIIAINAVDTTYALPGYTTDGTKITSIGVSTNMLYGDAVKVYFANTMTTVGGYNSVSSLNKIYLGNNVTTIAPNAFSYSGLTGDLILPITIANIGENAFNNCDFACEFPYIPNIAVIDNYAFNSCDGLIGTLHISGSVGNNAFENTGFDVIKITSGATSLGQDSLSNLTSLLRVYIDSSSISSLDSSNCGLLSNNTLTDVYVKEGLAVGEYISNNANFVLTKSNVSGYNHYGRAVEITWNGGSIAGTLDANLWNYAGSTGYTSTNAGSNSVYTFSGKNAISKVGINGENIYYLPTPIISGYTFNGWFTTADDTGVKVATADGWIASVSGYTDENKAWIKTDATTLYARYTKKSFTISYNLAGGGTSSTRPTSYTFGTTTSIPNPTRTGYTFLGWTVSSSLTGKTYGTINLGDGHQQFDSTYTSAVYYELYYLNNNITYTGELSDSEIRWRMYTTAGAYNGSLSSTPVTPSSDGYTSLWYHRGKSASNTTISFTTGTSYSVDAHQVGDLTLTARWKANTYTVTFNPNGGNVSQTSKTVTYDSTYGTLPTPTRTGYTFAGWFTAASGGTQITSETKVAITSAQTLYAHWTANEYTVTFNPNGGSVSQTSKTVTYDSTYGTLPTPTRTGYTFAGWFTAASGGTQITSETKVAITSAQTLYAHWTANEYTVTFNPNGGSVSQTSKTVTYDSTYGTLPTPTRTGYTFAGWFTAASGGTQITASTTVTTPNDHTLYAHWTANTYTVTFDPNQKGGLMTDVPDGTYTGNNATITYTSADHQYKFVNSSSSDPFATIEATVYLVANTTYTMHAKIYDANGVALTSGSIQIFYAINAAYSESNSKRISASGGSVTFTVPTTGTYRIRLDNDCGQTILIREFYITNEFATSKSVTYDSTYGTLPTPTRPGYTFNGWFTAASGGTQITSETKVAITSAQTLYAHWIQDVSYFSANWRDALANANSNYTATNIKTMIFTNTKPTSGTIVSVGATTKDGKTAWSVNCGVYDVVAYVTTNASDSSKYDVVFYSPVTIYAPVDSSRLFYDISNAISIIFNNFNTSNVTDMSEMFSDCLNLISLDLSSFDTSNVKDMRGMFSSCFDLESIDLSSFQTSKVIDLQFMFYDCSSLLSLDLSNFNTSNVTNMASMFYENGSLTNINISSFDTRKVTSMLAMFSGCHDLNGTLDLSSFDMSNVTDTYSMLSGCSSLSVIKTPKAIGSSAITLPSNNWYNEETIAGSYSQISSAILTNGSITLRPGYTIELLAEHPEVQQQDELYYNYFFSNQAGDSLAALLSNAYPNLNGTVANNANYIQLLPKDPALWTTVGTNKIQTTMYIWGNSQYSYRVPEGYFMEIIQLDYDGNTIGESWTFGNEYVNDGEQGDVSGNIKTHSRAYKLQLTLWNNGKTVKPSSVTTSALSSWYITMESSQVKNVWYGHEIPMPKVYVLGMQYSDYVQAQTGTITQATKDDTLHINFTSVANVGAVSHWEVITPIIYNLYFNTGNGAYNGRQGTIHVGSGYAGQSIEFDLSDILSPEGYCLTKLTQASGSKGGFGDESSSTITIWNNMNTSQYYTFGPGDATIQFKFAKNTASYLRKDWKSALPSIIDVTNIATIEFTKTKPTGSDYYTILSVGAIAANGVIAYVQHTLYVNDITAYVKVNSSDSSKYDIIFYSPITIYAPVDSSYLFSNSDTSKLFTNLTSITFDNFNTSSVTNMSYMFYGCRSLTSINLSSFNTSNVKSMSWMFSYCPSLTSLNISSFDTSYVINMGQMFFACINLTSLDLSNFNTSNVTNMGDMFGGCQSLTSLNLSSFNTSKVTSMVSMTGMFCDCSSLTSLDLSSFDMSNVTNTDSMLDGCTALTTIKTPKAIGSTAITLPAGNWFNEANLNGPYTSITSSMLSSGSITLVEKTVTITFKVLDNLGLSNIKYSTSSGLSGNLVVTTGDIYTTIQVAYGTTITISADVVGYVSKGSGVNTKYIVHKLAVDYNSTTQKASNFTTTKATKSISVQVVDTATIIEIYSDIELYDGVLPVG